MDLSGEMIGMSEAPSCAMRVPIFRTLPPSGLAELGRAMVHRRYARGERVAGAGDPVRHLLVVARGRLKVVHTSRSGREQVVRLLEQGDFLGELGLFTPTVHEGDVIAAEETDVCHLDRVAVQTIVRRHQDVAVALIDALARRLAQAEQLIADLGLRDVGQRLAAELLRMAEGPGAGGAGQQAPGVSGAAPVTDGSAAGGSPAAGSATVAGAVTVELPVPWAELAVRLGTTPESLSRRLRALVEQGVIRQEGHRTVVIPDVERLRRIAEL